MPLRIPLATIVSVRLGTSLFIRSKSTVERVISVRAPPSSMVSDPDSTREQAVRSRRASASER
jgi:hypothetical protein